MLGSISVSSMRKLMVLALAGGLALGGSSLGSGGAMAAGEAGPVLPDGPYAFDGGTAIFGAASRFGATAVGVNLTGGTAQLIGSCLPYGSGTYTAAPDGRWSFTPGTLSEKGCAGHEARQLAAEALAALTQATTWQLLPDPTNPTETAFAVTGPSGTLELQTDSLTIAPTPPDDPAPIPALEGDWRVETIERTNLPPRLAKTGPYAWKVTVWSDTVSFPDGAAAYTRPAYFVATPSGGFHVRQGRHVAIAAVLTPGLHNEYGDLATALSAANRWETPDSNTLVLSGADVRAVLSRPSASNLAFQVDKVEPAVTSIRVGVGQTVKVPVTAQPLAPRASATAQLTWRNSRGTVALVTTGAGQKLAKKSGKLTVPMNTGAVVRIKITGKKPGTSRVTFIAESGAKASIKIVVTSEKLNPNKIAITVPGNAHIMPIDGRRLLNLDFKITPAKATGAVAEWTSSAPLIAPVDTNGVVTLTTAIRDYPEPIAITARVGKLKAVYRLKQADWN